MGRFTPRDLWLVVPLLGIGLGGTRAAHHLQDGVSRAPDHWAYLLVALAALAVGLRRVRPAAMLAVSTTAVAVYLAAGYPYGPILLTLPVVAFLLAATWPRRRATAAGAAAVAVLGLAAVARGLLPGDRPWGGIVGLAAIWLPVMTALFVAGSTNRARRESAATARAEQARRAASEEQLRMAQELHDGVGHGLAVIAMQAGVALHLLDRDPGQARASLQAIRALSRESLDDLRTELDRLRGDAHPAARRPAPGVADLALLAERVRAGGVAVRLDVAVRPDELPAELGSTTYRVVQEALTNVLRHATAGRVTDSAGDRSTERSPVRADVRVARQGDDLAVRVSDTGPGVAVAGGGPAAGLREGNGIRGMRERVERLGGRLQVGTRPAGGFEVVALLPWSPA